MDDEPRLAFRQDCADALPRSRRRRVCSRLGCHRNVWVNAHENPWSDRLATWRLKARPLSHSLSCKLAALQVHVHTTATGLGKCGDTTGCRIGAELAESLEAQTSSLQRKAAICGLSSDLLTGRSPCAADRVRDRCWSWHRQFRVRWLPRWCQHQRLQWLT